LIKISNGRYCPENGHNIPYFYHPYVKGFRIDFQGIRGFSFAQGLTTELLKGCDGDIRKICLKVWNPEPMVLSSKRLKDS
jgi:hypothetical protein